MYNRRMTELENNAGAGATVRKQLRVWWFPVTVSALALSIGGFLLGVLGAYATQREINHYQSGLIAVSQWSRGGDDKPSYGDLVDAGDVSFIVQRAQGTVGEDTPGGNRHQFVTVTVQIQNLTASPITWNAADKATLTDTDGKTYNAQSDEVELPAQAASKELLNFVLPPNALPSHVDLQGTTGKTTTVSLNG